MVSMSGTKLKGEAASRDVRRTRLPRPDRRPKVPCSSPSREKTQRSPTWLHKTMGKEAHGVPQEVPKVRGVWR